MSDSIPQPKSQLKSAWFDKIIHHPIFGIIIGGIIATYFYFASIEKPNLTYYISPTRTAIVQKGTLQNFSVTYQGLVITNDLSSAEIQIWNQGKKPIKGGDIASGGNIERTICIRTPHGEPIYTITSATTRPEIGFKWIENANDSSGVKSFDWKILEQGDGIKLQIIYGGNVNLPIQIDGVVEDQKSITVYNAKSVSWLRRIANIAFNIFFYSFMFVVMFKTEMFLPQSEAKKSIIVRGIMLIILIVVLALCSAIISHFLSKPIKLPF